MPSKSFKFNTTVNGVLLLFLSIISSIYLSFILLNILFATGLVLSYSKICSSFPTLFFINVKSLLDL